MALQSIIISPAHKFFNMTLINKLFKYLKFLFNFFLISTKRPLMVSKYGSNLQYIIMENSPPKLLLILADASIKNSLVSLTTYYLYVT